MIHRRAFARGVRDVLPAIPANVPFGLVVGVAVVNLGLGVGDAVGMSALTFAGAAQLAAIELLDRGAPVVVVLLAAFVVNARYLMYSASLAPEITDLSRPWRWLFAYFLLDVTYALAYGRFRDGDVEDRRWYYMGVALPLWGTWVGATAVGAVLGTGVPPAWKLDFAVPLLFLGLLAPAIEDRATTVAALVGGTVAVVGAPLPYNVGLLAGALLGILAGIIVDRRDATRGRNDSSGRDTP